MDKVYEDMEVESIQFINNKNDMSFVICKCYGTEVAYKKQLIFENVLSFEMFAEVDKEWPFMPWLIVGISIKKIDATKMTEEGYNSLPNIAKNVVTKAYDSFYMVLMTGMDIAELNLTCENFTDLDFFE